MGKDPKVYEFNSMDDFIIYLNLLVEISVKHYKRFKYYFRELQDLTYNKFSELTGVCYEKIQENELDTLLENFKISTEFQNTRVRLKYIEYKNLEDKLCTPKNILLNAFADKTKNGVSYFRFRKELERKIKLDTKYDCKLEELSEEIRFIINELSSNRNYEHHLTDSKFIEWRSYREKQIKQANGQIIWPNENIHIISHDYISIAWLVQFYKATKELNECFSKILQQMKRDYSKLIGKTMNVIYRDADVNLTFEFSEISFNGIKRHEGKLK